MSSVCFERPRRAAQLLRAVLFAVITLTSLVLPSPTFAAFANGTGVARVPNPTSSDQGYGIALQSDGKIVVAGRCGESGAKLCVARLNADGSMDPTFNAAGPVPGKHVISGLALHTSSFLRSAKVLVAADGKVVVASTCDVSNRDRFCIARLNADGSLDDTFDGPDAANPGNGRFILPVSTDSVVGEALSDATLQRIDGRILLVGQCWHFHCVVRLKTSDGSYDTDSANFGLMGPSDADRALDPGINGRFVYRFPSSANSAGGGNAIAVETTNEGKIVIAGNCGPNGAARELCLTKFNRDGTFDSDFRGNSLPIGQGGRVLILATDASGSAVVQEAVDIKMQADGRFLVQCSYDYPANAHQQCLYRINSGGDVATSFSSGLPFPSEPGRVVYNALGKALAFAIVPPVGPSANGILALGDCDGENGFIRAFCVTAIRNGTGSADGTIDVALTGPNGDQAGTFFFSTRGPSSRFNRAREIVANADGEFFIVGECDGQMCVYKFRLDGALDTGLCLDDVDGDGKVSAASDGLAIMRSMLGVPTNANVPAGHGYDIDGDGVLNASRDGLLLVRRMLGFTDASLMQSVTFAQHARRATWTDIEAYLRKRCRIPRSQVTAP
ncbi:MAG: hypothetical protein ABL985_13475 [Casimicrobium sp.]